MPQLYFLRHAESMANVKNLLAGQKEFGLSTRGREEAGQLAEELAGMKPFQRLYSSTLSRARETAEPIAARLKLAIIFDVRLVEQNVGIYSGMSYSELKNQPDYEHDRSKRWDWIPKGGGESYRMMAERLTSFLNEISSDADASRCLIVTHAVALRVIQGALENTLPEYPVSYPQNGEILRCDFEGLNKKNKTTWINLLTSPAE
ncbi:MAG: histidine phosphatase family protein [Calditrichia bacterium]